MIDWVYIAAPFARYKEVLELAAKLRASGFCVIAAWAYVAEAVFERSAKPDEYDEAKSDLGDIDKCQAVVSLHFDGEGRGMYYEMGYAKHAGIPVFMMGARNQCVFQALHTHVDDYEALIKALRSY